MTPDWVTGTARDGPSGAADEPGAIRWMTALHPVLHDWLRWRTAAPVVRTRIRWEPLSVVAWAVTELPAPAGPPSGAVIHAHPKVWTLRKTPKLPRVPVNLQCGLVTSSCRRPSRATVPQGEP